MKERADKMLVAQGLAPSRERAQALILAGHVFSRGQRVDKPGQALPLDQELEVRGQDHCFVSRGGLKLEKALDAFALDVGGQICLDVGASTGGFTDCLLQRGAARVYAVDVGRGQLDWKLRQDARVVVREQLNARFLTDEHIPEPVDFACLDVSFISLKLVLGPVSRLLSPQGRVVALIKPQFEAGRAEVGKGGVVTKPETHERVLGSVLDGARELGLSPFALTFSPVRGPAGNIEFLAGFARDTAKDAVQSGEILACVRQAWDCLGKG